MYPAGSMIVKRPGYLPPNPPSQVDQAYTNYGKTASGQAGDYNDIMNRYRGLLTDISNARNQLNSSGSAGTYAPTIPTYQTTQDYTSAIGNLGGLARTGGYSTEDINNIRERGISPIRSVYANAQQDLARQKSLQGGYSPNYAATSAKMARELSSQLADKTTAVNAEIAQNVAQNKIATSVPYANIAAGEQGSRNDFALKAADMANEAKRNALTFANERFLLPIQAEQGALAGMRDLFGTAPGFTTTMGNMANNQAEIQAGIQANNQNFNRSILPYALG